MKSSINSTIYNLSNVNSTLDLYYNTTDTVSTDVSNITTKTQFTILEKSFQTNATDKKYFSMPTTIDSSLNKELTTPVKPSKMKTTESLIRKTEILKTSMENSFTIHPKMMNPEISIEKENYWTTSKTDFNENTSRGISTPTKSTSENKPSGKHTNSLNDEKILSKTESMKLTTSQVNNQTLRTSTQSYSTSKITSKILEIETEKTKDNSLMKTTESKILKETETMKEKPNLSTRKFIDGKSSTSTNGKFTTTFEKINEKETERNILKETTMKEKPNRDTTKFTTEKSSTSTNGKLKKSTMEYSSKFQRKQTTENLRIKSTDISKRIEEKKSKKTMSTFPMDFKTSQPFKNTKNKTTNLFKLKKNLSTRTSNFVYNGMISNASLKSDYSVTFTNPETTTEPNHTMGAGPLVIVVLLPFLALFLIAVVTALRRKMKKSRGRIVRVQSRDLDTFSDRNQSQMIPLTKPDPNENN